MLLGRASNGFMHPASAFICWRCQLSRFQAPPLLATYATSSKATHKRRSASRRKHRAAKSAAVSSKIVDIKKHSATPSIRKYKGTSTLTPIIRRIPLARLESGTHENARPRFRTLREALLVNARVAQAEDHDSSRSIVANKLEFKPLDVPVPAVPKLGYGLQRALFNAGVIQLRDLHTRVYNFDPYLEKLIPVKDFDFNTLPTFTTSSKDPVLRGLTKQSEKRYFGSTSSTTAVLAHFHFLLSRWRNLNTDMLPKDTPCYPTFTKISRAPAAIFLRWNEGDQTYAIDADKEYDSANVLSMMGRYMEKLLTLDKAQFELHRRDKSHLLREEDTKGPDAYHYSTMENIVIRSQLDAHDSRLPGTGMFDLKTRAVLPIRMDSANFEWGMKYELRQLHGEWESFAREYADMLRSTLLKYSLQARMGRMDGIFVAYHNIARIFGVQYIPIREMDAALHGQEDGTLGDQEFLTSFRLLNEIFDKATEKFPKQSLRIHFETRETVEPFMYVFAEPVAEPQIEAMQARSKERIEKWEQEMLGIKIPSAVTAEPTSAPSERKLSTEEKQDVEVKNSQEEKNEPTSSSPLFGMQLYVKSYVNGKAVQRPTNLTASDKWTINFSMKEMEKENRLRSLYEMLKSRRKAELDEVPDEKYDDYFIKKIKAVTEKSAEWRRDIDRRDEKSASKIRYWNDEADTSGSIRHEAKEDGESKRDPMVASGQRRSQDLAVTKGDKEFDVRSKASASLLANEAPGVHAGPQKLIAGGTAVRDAPEVDKGSKRNQRDAERKKRAAQRARRGLELLDHLLPDISTLPISSKIKDEASELLKKEEATVAARGKRGLHLLKELVPHIAELPAFLKINNEVSELLRREEIAVAERNLQGELRERRSQSIRSRSRTSDKRPARQDKLRPKTLSEETLRRNIQTQKRKIRLLKAEMRAKTTSSEVSVHQPSAPDAAMPTDRKENLRRRIEEKERAVAEMKQTIASMTMPSTTNEQPTANV